VALGVVDEELVRELPDQESALAAGRKRTGHELHPARGRRRRAAAVGRRGHLAHEAYRASHTVGNLKRQPRQPVEWTVDADGRLITRFKWET